MKHLKKVILICSLFLFFGEFSFPPAIAKQLSVIIHYHLSCGYIVTFDYGNYVSGDTLDEDAAFLEWWICEKGWRSAGAETLA
jgi:hypothetical protein